MNINLEDFQKEVDLAERYQKALENIASLQQTIKKFSLENVLLAPTDRLIHSGEAAKLLGVNQNKISSLVKKGLLTPLYIDAEPQKILAQRSTCSARENHQSTQSFGRDCPTDCLPLSRFVIL